MIKAWVTSIATSASTHKGPTWGQVFRTWIGLISHLWAHNLYSLRYPQKSWWFSTPNNWNSSKALQTYINVQFSTWRQLRVDFFICQGLLKFGILVRRTSLLLTWHLLMAKRAVIVGVWHLVSFHPFTFPVSTFQKLSLAWQFPWVFSEKRSDEILSRS